MSTQLNYAFITPPNPYFIVAGQPAELGFTVSNPGKPVTLYSLAFQFPYGSFGSDLCGSVRDVSVETLPPPSLSGAAWTASTDKWGNFVLTPPKGSISVVDGFTFTLSIQVNSQSGVLNLNNDRKPPVQSFNIIESTDAGKASWSPLVPLSKFPAAFQFSDLSANPSTADQGEAIVLSWAGTSGSVYTIDWPKGEATYSGGLPPITQEDASFPPTGSGQTLRMGASQTVVFSVTAEAGALHTAPLSVPVGVNLDAPTITSFTATWQGAVLALSWATENATSVEIPAITSETLNPNSSETPFLFTPSSTKPLPSGITLTARNQASQTASQTLVKSYLQVAGSPFAAGNGPTSVAASPDGARVYVANYDAGTLTVLDAGTLQPIGLPVPVGEKATSVAVSPDSTRIFVANQLESGWGALTVLDAATLKPAGSPVQVGLYAISVAVSPDGMRVFVANYIGGSLTVLDARTLEPVTVLDARTLEPVTGPGPPLMGNHPSSVAVSPDGMRVFVASQSVPDGTPGALAVLDARTLKPVTLSPVPVGVYPASVAVCPDGRRVLVADSSDNTLTVLDAGTLQPVTGLPVPVGKGPVSVAVSPDSRRVFVANWNGNTLTVLDAATLQPVTGLPVPVGANPSSVAVSPDGRRVFVANEHDNTLTVLTGGGQY